jgi:glycosyltransferase involved in cell wall biosynthesis
MIYYDVTDLIDFFRKTPRVTGIQRVSLATLARFQALGVASELQPVAYHPRLRRLVTCDLGEFPTAAVSGAELSACIGIRYKGPSALDSYLRRYKAGRRRTFHRVRLTVANFFSRGRTFRRKCIAETRTGSSLAPIAWRPVAFTAQDVAIVPGGLQSRERLFAGLREARSQQGVRLVQFIHDVLPISHPQFVPEGRAFAFAELLLAANDSSQLIVTTSAFNDAEYRAEMAKRDRPAPPIKVIPLAHEFLEDGAESAKPLYERVSTPVLAAARLPFVLCVGTREIRKNNFGLAQAWAQLEKKHGPALPRLIFAGRSGWMNEDFDRFLQRSNAGNDTIRIVENASEQELAYLYKNCLFSVFPSFCEGWGLPIGESLWFGRPVITSKLTAMPEVASGYADYVDPYDCNDIMEAVERMLDPAYRQKRVEAIKTMPLRRWSDFADDLLNSLRAFAGER